MLEMDCLENTAVLVDALKGALEGKVFSPGEDGFDAARASWNLTTDHRPEVIVVATSEADVMAAVEFAQLHDMRFAFRRPATVSLETAPRACCWS